jgi:predicted transcriptional regulator
VQGAAYARGYDRSIRIEDRRARNAREFADRLRFFGLGRLRDLQVLGAIRRVRGRSGCACPARRRRGFRRLRAETSFFTSLRPWLSGLSVALLGLGFCFRLMRFSLADHLLAVIQNNMCYRSGIMGSNEKTISFRAVSEKIDALDSLAAAQDRSRSYLINEAISNYIELHAYQDALVRKGLEEKRKGRVVSHEEVVKGLKRAGRARQ